MKLFSALLVLFLTAPGWSVPVTLFDNLDELTVGIETMPTGLLQAQQFLTGSSGGFLTETVLLMQEDIAGGAVVDIYTSIADTPASLLGSLSTAGAFSSTPAEQTFTGNVALAANSAYFVVLRVTSGEYGWAFTMPPGGSGVGYSDRSASSIDAGANWSLLQGEPLQMSVTMQSDAVPELGGGGAPLALSLMAGMLLGLSSRRRV
jgi:hypothetical protein